MQQLFKSLSQARIIIFINEWLSAERDQHFQNLKAPTQRGHAGQGSLDHLGWPGGPQQHHVLSLLMSFQLQLSFMAIFAMVTNREKRPI